MSLFLQGRSAEMLSLVISKHLSQEQEAMYPLCLHSLLSCKPSKKKQKQVYWWSSGYTTELGLWYDKAKAEAMLSLLLDHRISFCNSPTSILSGWATAMCCINWFMMQEHLVVEAPFCTHVTVYWRASSLSVLPKTLMPPKPSHHTVRHLFYVGHLDFPQSTEGQLPCPNTGI